MCTVKDRLPLVANIAPLSRQQFAISHKAEAEISASQASGDMGKVWPSLIEVKSEPSQSQGGPVGVQQLMVGTQSPRMSEADDMSTGSGSPTPTQRMASLDDEDSELDEGTGNPREPTDVEPEEEDGKEQEVRGADATEFRALVARVNFLAQDRTGIVSVVKEL